LSPTGGDQKGGVFAVEKTNTEKLPFSFFPLGRKNNAQKIFRFSQAGKRINWVSFLWFAAAILLGRASLMGEVAPFALIFWALVLRFQPEKRHLVTIAVLLGWLTSGASIFPPWFLPAAMILWKLLDYLLAELFKKKVVLFLSLPLTVVFLRLPVLYSYHFPVYEVLIAGLEIILAALLPPLLQPFFEEMESINLTKRPKPEIIVAGLLFFALIFLGMSGIKIGDNFLLVNIVPPSLILIGAYLWGPVWGVSAGIVLGLCLCFSDPSMLVYVGALGVSGLLAGILSRYNRFWAAAGYFLGLRLLAFYGLEGGYTLTSPWEDLIIVAVFLMMPDLVWQKLRWLGSFWPFKMENEEKLRLVMASRLKEFAAVFKELAVTFQPLGEAEELHSKRDLSPLVNYFSRRVCQSCEHFKRCWQEDLYGQYRRVLTMLSTMEESGRFSEKMIPVKLRRYCPRQREIVKTVGSMKEVYHLNCHWQEKIHDSRRLVSQQLSGISTVIHDLAQELKLKLGEKGSQKEKQADRFRLEIGVAQVARDGYSVSGDSYAVLSLEEGKQAILLSDGMGNGKEARLASVSTIKLLEHLLCVGFKKDIILNTINTLLRLRYPAERFATLDFAMLNMQEGKIDLYKLGAPPSYLKNGQVTKIIGSGSLPIGILEEIAPEVKSLHVPQGGTLVMVTDGVLDSQPGEEESWIIGALQEIRHDHPQIIADRLIEEACYRWPRGVQDDLTVLVGRLQPII
jgi:stage II sporulation protein E